MNVLSLDGLTVEFSTGEGIFRPVDHVSFDIPVNRTVALVGESGSGKTVISQAIMGLLPKSASIVSGKILLTDPLLDGKTTDISNLKPHGKRMRALRGDRMALVFQEPMTSLSPLHKIGDQIGEAARLHRNVSASEARELTREMLRLVQFPDPDQALSTYPFELSGGLRQRAMIAMAMICRPALLIADEPTTALDVTIQAEILKLIKDVQSELNMSVLLITHDFGVVANMADDVVVIYRGKIMEKGSAHQLFSNPRHDYLKALLQAVPHFGMDRDERLCPIRPVEVKLGDNAPRVCRKEDAGKELVRLENVSKSFALRKGGILRPQALTLNALDQISLTIRRGECLGLVGESGSGKSTAARAILRAMPINSGKILYDFGKGLKDISSLASEELLAYRRRVQLIFQDPFSSLNPRMTVNELLSEPLEIHKVGTKAERFERVRDLMQLVGLDPRYLRRYPHSFSGGQRQRIGIARALALNPELILCDEPTSALDVSVQAQILNLLNDLKKELGLTYLFVSHNLAVVDYISDRVAVMCRGRVVEMGPTRSVISDPQHPYTQALMTAVPRADLDKPLDFAALDRSRASDPAEWPAPYRLVPGLVPHLVEVQAEHFVCIPDDPDIPSLYGDGAHLFAEASV